MEKQKPKINYLEKISLSITQSVGTPLSILFHTLFFIGIFGLALFGWTIDKILLVLTTAVSLEAIYLAIFIQMTVNRQTESIKAVEEDIDEIQEDVEDIQEDVEGMEEDVDELQEDVDKMTEKEKEQSLKHIEFGLQKLLAEVENLKKDNQQNAE